MRGTVLSNVRVFFISICVTYKNTELLITRVWFRWRNLDYIFWKRKREMNTWEFRQYIRILLYLEKSWIIYGREGVKKKRRVILEWVCIYGFFLGGGGGGGDGINNITSFEIKEQWNVLSPFDKDKWGKTYRLEKCTVV